MISLDITLHRLADALQQPFGITFGQLIKQAQSSLHNPCICAIFGNA